MAISLKIKVVNASASLDAGYTHIRTYRSAEQTVGFSEISIPASLIPLVSGTNEYNFIDETGTTQHFYRNTFIDSAGIVPESAFSASFQGDYLDVNFAPITYPVEEHYTADDYFVIDKVRRLLGDQKELTRDVVSVETGYDSVSADGLTHALSTPKGWPLRIIKDGVEHTDETDPRVNDYQFITFSGSIINTVTGTLDIWYYTFRHSDNDILQTFNGLTPPPELNPEDITFELSIVCTAHELLSSEVRKFAATSSTEVDIFEEIRINPRGSNDARLTDLERLRKQKERLIKEIQRNVIEAELVGVLID